MARRGLPSLIPKTAKHKLLKVRLTIWFGDQSKTSIATFAVR